MKIEWLQKYFRKNSISNVSESLNLIWENFTDANIFFCQKSAFFGKNGTFTQSNSVTAVLEIF